MRLLIEVLICFVIIPTLLLLSIYFGAQFTSDGKVKFKDVAEYTSACIFVGVFIFVLFMIFR